MTHYTILDAQKQRERLQYWMPVMPVNLIFHYQ